MENLEDTILNMANTKRYSVDSFSPCKAKRVPYEQLDFSIYKPSANLVAFSTSEERLPIWIAAMKARYQDGLLDNQKVTTRWEEQENASDPAKCEKVTISLISKKSSENLITITASINYGRIQVQGKFFKEWSNQEFLQLIETVNNSCNPDNANKDLQNFVDLLFKNETRTNLPKTTTDKQHLDTDNTSLLNEESIVNSMKNSLATLEADYVLFKQTSQTKINELTTLINNKDDEISSLKNEITTLKKASVNHQQFISDSTLKQSQTDDEMKKLQNKCRLLEKKNTDLLQKIVKKNEENNNSIKETQDPNASTSTTMINTSNSFNPIAVDDIQTQEEELEPRPEHTPSKNEQIEEPTNSPKPSVTQNNHETIIMCDSNGRHINPKLLCPGTKVSYIRCPTIKEANRIIEHTNFTSPKTFILHFGTNDLDSTPSNEDMINQLKITTLSLSEKYPNSKIISSSLLPRKDDINKQINYINENLEKELSGSPNIVIVKHQNIRIQDLRDNKHLNTIGVKRFAQNLKRSYFGLPLGKKPPQNSNQHRTNNQDRPQNRFTWHSNPPNTSYTPAHQIPASYQPAQQYFGKNYFSHNPHHLFNYNTPFNAQPPNYRGHNMRTKVNLNSQQEKGNLPTEMVELIKLLHTRYVNK